MAKIKHTKNELKAQRDALKRFQRYLPTLLLKKQQLQMEVRALEAKAAATRAAEKAARDRLSAWVRLFAEPIKVEAMLKVRAVRRSTGNIAGVAIPVFEGIDFDRTALDLFATPAWTDDGLATIETLTTFRVEGEILEEQLRRLAEELRTTSQRVNLFEKVKIPEAKENIRVVRIFLGDQMTAEVARSKIAKGKSGEKGTAA